MTTRRLRFVVGAILLAGAPGCADDDDPSCNPCFDAGFDAAVDAGDAGAASDANDVTYDGAASDGGDGVLCDCCTGLVPASGFDRCEEVCGPECMLGSGSDAGIDSGS